MRIPRIEFMITGAGAGAQWPCYGVNQVGEMDGQDLQASVGEVEFGPLIPAFITHIEFDP